MSSSRVLHTDFYVTRSNSVGFSVNSLLMLCSLRDVIGNLRDIPDA